MTDNSSIRFMRICAAGALVAGVFLSIGARHDLERGRVKLRRKLAELEELRGMERRIVRYRGAYKAFGGLSVKRPAAMGDLLKRHMAGHAAEDSRSTRQNLVPGWTVRRQEMGLGEVSMDKVMALVHDAESGRPPWRLTRCIVRATSGGAGKARVDLVFEALDGE